MVEVGRGVEIGLGVGVSVEGRVGVLVGASVGGGRVIVAVMVGLS